MKIPDDELLEDLFKYIQWSQDIRVFSDFDVLSIERSRNVSTNSPEGTSGSFFSEKMEREIQYESQLEKNFLLKLECSDNVKYYFEQPIKIDYVFHDKKTFYRPDILVILKDGKGFLVEIKNMPQMASYKNIVKMGVLKKFCENKGFGYLITDGKKAIQQYLEREVNPEFEKAVLANFDVRKSLEWKRYQKMKKDYHISDDDLLVVVIKNKLTWELRPFRVRKRETNIVKSKQRE